MVKPVNPKPFDFQSAVKLENYVRHRYRSQLSNGALSFYCCAFPALERSELGLCQPITKGHRALALAGLVSKDSVGKYLSELNGILCEIVSGSPIKSDKRATRIRRYTLHELINGEPRRKLIDYAPTDARELATHLHRRTFVYGDVAECRPAWSVLKTGRVQSSKPNVQGDPEGTRIKHLCAGLQPGLVLIHADYKAAEPTVIQDTIGYHFEANPYQTAADLLGIERREAKPKVNALAYHQDSMAALSFWCHPVAEREFAPYVEALTAYREQLWQNGKPRNGKRRFVNTFSGRKIEADKGETAHRGRILAWQIQGTVADILNAATISIIQQETAKGWKLCFPEHDAVYVIGKPEHTEEIKGILKSEAARLGKPLAVKTEIHGIGDVV